MTTLTSALVALRRPVKLEFEGTLARCSRCMNVWWTSPGCARRRFGTDHGSDQCLGEGASVSDVERLFLHQYADPSAGGSDVDGGKARGC